MSLKHFAGLVLAASFVLSLAVGCGDDPAADAPKQPAAPPAPSAPAAAPGESAANPADPKAEMARQLELLKAGDLEGLRACFTERIRPKVTKEKMDEGVEAMTKQNITLESMVGSVEEGEFEGKKTAKITMTSGRTLTTLIQQEDGRWLADTLWFD